MVEKFRGYNAPALKVFHGATPCNPLSPIIFNAVMDTIMLRWVTVVAEEEVGPEGLGPLIQLLVVYLYDNDSPIVSTWVGRLQQYFDTL